MLRDLQSFVSGKHLPMQTLWCLPKQETEREIHQEKVFRTPFTPRKCNYQQTTLAESLALSL